MCGTYNTIKVLTLRSNLVGLGESLLPNTYPKKKKRVYFLMIISSKSPWSYKIYEIINFKIL